MKVNGKDKGYLMKILAARCMDLSRGVRQGALTNDQAGKRLGAILDHIDALLAGAGPTGRKVDFLARNRRCLRTYVRLFEEGKDSPMQKRADVCIDLDLIARGGGQPGDLIHNPSPPTRLPQRGEGRKNQTASPAL